MKNLASYVVAMQKQKHYVAMIFVQFVYAGLALLSKAAITRGMNPFVFVVYRQAFATIALAPFAFFLEREKPSLTYFLFCKIFLVSLCGLTLSLNLYYVAINFTTATFAAASTNTIPVLTFVMALLFRMERVCIGEVHGIAKVLGCVVSVSGAMVFAFVKGPPLDFMNWSHGTETQARGEASTKSWSTSQVVKGSVMMLAGNTAWSLWIILQSSIMKQYPAKIRLTALQCFFSCIQSGVWAFAGQRIDLSAWELGWDLHLLSVAYSGLLVTAVTYWIQAWVMEKKGPVFTATFNPLSLIITAIFSAFFWKDRLTWGSVGGGILLIGGLYGVLWGKKKEELRNSSSVIPTTTNYVANHQIQESSKEDIMSDSITCTPTTP